MVRQARNARERARGELTAAIKDEARRQLAAEGASRLSLRAVAREVGMVSSALYRYFPSRDELLTALIIDAYDAVGAAAERALAEAEQAGETFGARWLAVCRTVRAWALDHPHEYALLYGTPVPGYAAPQTTTGPASRMPSALLRIVRDAHAAGELCEPASGGPAPTEELLAQAEQLAVLLEIAVPAAATVEVLIAWAQLSGLVSFELFGQFHGVVDARDALFDHAAAGLATRVGLAPSPGVR